MRLGAWLETGLDADSWCGLGSDELLQSICSGDSPFLIVADDPVPLIWGVRESCLTL